ncbi:hypothetical protein HKD37_16G044945 [Glycine soja]
MEVPKEDTNLKDKQMDGLVISLSDVESLRWASPWLNTLVMNVLNKIFLKVDKLTSIHSSGKFVRICVEIELEKPLVSHTYVRSYKLNMEYEGLHSISFRCGRVGHKRDQCSKLMSIPKDA